MSYVVVNNYINPQESESIINYLNCIFTAKPGLERSVKRFGKTASYSGDKVSNEIPVVLQYLINKLEVDGYASDIQHVTVNRYDIGQTIPFHVDAKDAGEVITVISLLSDCNMLFKDTKGKLTGLKLPPNSLLQFDGDHRWNYKHSIELVTSTRYSIVFRKQ